MALRNGPDFSPPPGAPDLGAWLAFLRQDAGFTIAQLSAKTKILPRHLEGLERGDWKGIPSKVHARAFALAFARACDADDDEAIVRLRKAMDLAPSPEESRVTTAPERVRATVTEEGLDPERSAVMADIEGMQGEERLPWRGWLLLATLVALLIWGFHGVRMLIQRSNVPQRATPAGRSAANDPEPTAVVSPVAEGAELSLRAKRPTWVILQIDGERLPTITLERDVKRTWKFKQRAVMLAGNIGAVRVWWRGENLGYFGSLGERMNGVVFEPGQPWRRDAQVELALPAGVPEDAPKAVLGD